MSSLHITNGTSVGSALQHCVSGTILSWDDPMHHGPFKAGLDLAATSVMRANYLAGPGLNAENVRKGFEKRDAQFSQQTDFDEIVLWFEHDLLDQLQLIQILDQLAEADREPQTIKLICINAFEHIDPFRGLGQLTPHQLQGLLPNAEPVTTIQLKVAQQAWAAFCAEDPNQLVAFLTQDSKALPFLAPALRRHLQDYAWTTDGLTRTERQLLHLLKDGAQNAVTLFVENMNYENCLFIGDWRTWTHIHQLSSAPNPLMTTLDEAPFRYPPGAPLKPQQMSDQILQLTDLGKLIISGDQTAHSYLKRDEWLGGVHIQTDHNPWLWAPDIQNIVRPD